ncbi:ligand-binding sensor domain-containing protein [Flavitalea flava]
MTPNKFLQYCFAYCLATLPITSFAQLSESGPVRFEHYTTTEGLSSSQIRAISQDRYGFIWIATTDGLNRFDGRQFTIYRHLANDSNSLVNNIINSIAPDADGKLWIATNNGLCYYDFSDDRCHSIDIRSNNGEPIDRYRVYQVLAGKEKRIWYTTLTQLHFLEPDGSIHSFDLPSGLKAHILTLLEDDQGRIWIGTNNNSILLFDWRKNLFAFIPLHVDAAYPNRNPTLSVTRISQQSADTFLACTWNGGLQQIIMPRDPFSGHDFSILPCPDRLEKNESKRIVTSICPSPCRQQFWVATYGNGLALYDKTLNQFIAHQHHLAAEKKSLCNEFVNAVFLDASGILWIGTDEGLDKFDTLANRFSALIIPELTGGNLHKQEVVELIADRDDTSRNGLWMAASGQGLLYYDAGKGVRHFYRTLPTEGHRSVSCSVNCLFQDRAGTLWVGTKEAVYTFDKKKKLFKRLLTDSSWMGAGSVTAIMEDSKGRMWFSVFDKGVYRYCPGTGQWKGYRHPADNSSGLPDDHVFCLLEDSRKRIWIGTQNQGLCMLEPERDAWTIYRQLEKNNGSLPDNNVYALLEDKFGQLWIGTENGLARMNLRDNTIKTFTTADGLCNNDIYDLAQSPDQHIWLATNNGLSDFDPFSGKFRNYYTNDGLPGNSLEGAFRCLPSGRIVLGMAGGICYFNAAGLMTNRKIPEVVITAFNIFDAPYPIKRIGTRIEPVGLNYKQNMITFHFTALNFTNSANNRYAYKLEGFDKGWTYCGNRTSATYTNLDGGSYDFRVKASNNDGLWNEKGTDLRLIISPPFRKTGWFYLLVLVCMASAFYIFYRIRLIQLLQLHKMRANIARDLHDDIGSTLSSISMMSRMAVENPDHPTLKEKSAELLSTIARASKQAMDQMSDIVWSIDPINERLENILIRMREYAGEMLEAADIRLCFETDDKAGRLSMSLKNRKEFLLIFKEAVNNLAKYSGANRAFISLTCQGNKLHLRVEDNGIGFDTTHESKGNGLKNMRERAAVLGALLTIGSHPGGGTIIKVCVPLIP